MGSDVGVCLPLVRDSRFFGLSTGMSDGVIGGGACRLVCQFFGTFRPANAGCFLGRVRSYHVLRSRCDTPLRPLVPQRVPRFRPHHHQALIGLTTVYLRGQKNRDAIYF